MKKSKLSIEKFRISQLSNPSKILGGNPTPGNGDITEEKVEKKEVCILTSTVKIKKV